MSPEDVAGKMVELNAIIGGEGNGGVMLPDVHIGRDALVAAVLTIPVGHSPLAISSCASYSHPRLALGFI